MTFRTRKFYLVLLITSSLFRVVTAAEKSNGELSTDEETAVEDRIVEVADESKTTIVSTSSRKVKKQEGRSIKMIVGGQSEDGIAKEVTVPIQD